MQLSDPERGLFKLIKTESENRQNTIFVFLDL